MDIFNPKILDACIRDVAYCLSDNQKADLLLYAMTSLKYAKHKVVIENAIQACLSIHALSPSIVAKARILRARLRLDAGSFIGAQEDLHAALLAEPDNPEATALLHQRSVAVEKLLAPTGHRISNEVWREIALFLPRRDLKTLLSVPHPLSRVASQLLFRKVDLHFGEWEGGQSFDEGEGGEWEKERDRDQRRPTSSPAVVRTLRIFATVNSHNSFQTGILSNALPKMINLRRVHISSSADGVLPVLKILQSCSPKLNGLSLHVPDGLFELSTLTLNHIANFAYHGGGSGNGGAQNPHAFLAQHRSTLRTLSLENPAWVFPADALSLRNLTHIHFLGQFPLNSQAIGTILNHGRQLESLSLTSMNRRLTDRDLFPSIAEFLRGRCRPSPIQKAVGFDASVWGVLPSLTGLKGLGITYPRDLAPGLAAWLIPRSVVSLTLNGLVAGMRISASGCLQVYDFVAGIVEQGFPMVRVVRVASTYWTVHRKKKSGRKGEDGGFELERWPVRRGRYHVSEWLEWFGCEDALGVEDIYGI
ncbi:hypothetical protein EDD18DRAFT_1200360 [Armillaria luteobubalina]|uniref:Uncharacterized protein n=1 Tax=Armillaria luteobubalina TaxID=153913 RepID=A0AA39PF77_9AGAR|nr:hypothetical protein EDD18DRAFT_1200360 [Armillaria luteobubalina]